METSLLNTSSFVCQLISKKRVIPNTSNWNLTEFNLSKYLGNDIMVHTFSKWSAFVQELFYSAKQITWHPSRKASKQTKINTVDKTIPNDEKTMFAITIDDQVGFSLQNISSGNIRGCPSLRLHASRFWSNNGFSL